MDIGREYTEWWHHQMQIRDAVGRMTELISSLLEFSRSQPVLQPIQGDVAEVVERVVRAMRFRAEFGQIRFTHVREGPTEARFDPKKLERALYNLVLNACEAVPLDSGKIDICTIRAGDEIEIIIADNVTRRR